MPKLLVRLFAFVLIPSLLLDRGIVHAFCPTDQTIRTSCASKNIDMYGQQVLSAAALWMLLSEQHLTAASAREQATHVSPELLLIGVLGMAWFHRPGQWLEKIKDVWKVIRENPRKIYVAGAGFGMVLTMFALLVWVLWEVISHGEQIVAPIADVVITLIFKGVIYAMGTTVGDIVVVSLFTVAAAKAIQEVYTKPNVTVDFDDIPFDYTGSSPLAHPTSFLQYVGLMSTLNIYIWVAIVLTVIGTAGAAPRGLLFSLLVVTGLVQLVGRFLFSIIVKKIKDPRNLLGVYRGEIPLLETDPRDLKVKAIGYKFKIERWWVRHKAVLWLEEPYVLRWFGLISPLARYIVPVRGTWKSLNEVAKDWIKGLSLSPELAPVRIPEKKLSPISAHLLTLRAA